MGRTTEKLEERQQSKAHGHKQQGQLDDAGHDLVVNSCVRQQHLAHMLDRQVIKVVVSPCDDFFQHRHDQFFE